MVGILVIVPLAIVVIAPLLLRWRLLDLETPPAYFGETERSSSRLGDWIERTGLTFATGLLTVLLLWTHVSNYTATWALWASCLVLVVWACIRQGLAGGLLAAGVSSLIVLAAAQIIDARRGDLAAVHQKSIQGNLLAFCCSALLVGVSISWLRATESRFRHVIGRIPFVVYAARLPRGIGTEIDPSPGPSKPDSKFDVSIGPFIGESAKVLLVSPAAQIGRAHV